MRQHPDKAAAQNKGLERFDLPGPFGSRPRLAVAVSGGADSMALAILARDWANIRDGSVLALIVDHGLRLGSKAEAELVRERLSQLAVPALVLTLRGVGRGADAARRARYAALEAECERRGIVHLLLGHHATDQAETLQIRALAGSGSQGFAGMAALRERHFVRWLRPLLSWAPAELRHFLRERDVVWVEDPSNSDPRAQRGRLRRLGLGHDQIALSQAAHVAAEGRAAAEREAASWLAANAQISPLGFALIPKGRLPVLALGALIQMVSGEEYPPPVSQLASIAFNPSEATLGGVCIRSAGRMGSGWLLARELAAIGSSVRLSAGVVWDKRFRVSSQSAALPKDCVISQVGPDASRLRRFVSLPHYVIASLPSIRIVSEGGRCQEPLAAVPHIGYAICCSIEGLRLQYCPSRPAACAPWWNPRVTGGAQ